jgi:hypothetical protein
VTGLGELLNKASAALEEANAQALESVLAGIDYNDERKLGDGFFSHGASRIFSIGTATTEGDV